MLIDYKRQGVHCNVFHFLLTYNLFYAFIVQNIHLICLVIFDYRLTNATPTISSFMRVLLKHTKSFVLSAVFVTGNAPNSYLFAFHTYTYLYFDCISDATITQRAEALCQGEQRCQLTYDSLSLWDTCQGTYKYSEVMHACENQDRHILLWRWNDTHSCVPIVMKWLLQLDALLLYSLMGNRSGKRRLINRTNDDFKTALLWNWPPNSFWNSIWKPLGCHWAVCTFFVL